MKQPVFRQALFNSVIALLFATPAYAQARAHLTLQDLLSVEPIGDAALSPDGKTMALTRNGQVTLMPSAGGGPVTLTSTMGGKAGLAWSPEGRQLA